MTSLRHDEGLLDVMSAFGVNNVFRKAAVTENFSYNKVPDIYNYLMKHFNKVDQKKYFLVESETIQAKEAQKEVCYIKGCRSCQIICSHPNGGIQAKQNICSSTNCFLFFSLILGQTKKL